MTQRRGVQAVSGLGSLRSARLEVTPDTMVVVADRKPRMTHRADCPFLLNSVVRPVRTTEVAGQQGRRALPYCPRCRAQDLK